MSEDCLGAFEDAWQVQPMRNLVWLEPTHHFGTTLKWDIFFTWRHQNMKTFLCARTKTGSVMPLFVIFRPVRKKLKLTVSFDHPVPVSHTHSQNSHFCSCYQISGMWFLIPVPIPKSWGCNFSFPFPLPKFENGLSYSRKLGMFIPIPKSWEWESGIPVSHSCSWKLSMQFLIPVPFSGMVLWGRRWESDRKWSNKDWYQRLTLI